MTPGGIASDTSRNAWIGPKPWLTSRTSTTGWATPSTTVLLAPPATVRPSDSMLDADDSRRRVRRLDHGALDVRGGWSWRGDGHGAGMGGPGTGCSRGQGRRSA